MTRYSYLGDHAARANTSSFAAFAVTLFCLVVQGVPTPETALVQNLASVIAYRAVHSPTLDPVETMTGPSKTHYGRVHSLTRNLTSGHITSIGVLLVDQAGVEPASRTLLGLLHTAINLIIYLFSIVVNRRTIFI